MDDRQLHDQINELVQREHVLRKDPAGDRDELRQVEVTLDQCWDLLRQRDALRAAGSDPGGAHVRPASEVEGYRQ
ncbi:DUF2630 family protein [Angustibacter peucedani]